MLNRPAADPLERAIARIDLSGRQSMLVAVSGGSDSVALLLAAEHHLKQSHPAIRLHAATVDHRLRPESGVEARSVAAFCAARGIPHLILAWDGPKPRTGIAAAAREARYRLIGEAAAAAGTDLVLTGHTLDDQAETVAMRAQRGEGRGLAGMAGATLHEGRVWIVRPFLPLRRAALRTELAGRGIGWIEDPSNRNDTAERVRIRASLAEAEILRWAATAETAGRSRSALGEAAARLINRAAFAPVAGGVSVDRARFDGDPAARLYALRILLAFVGAREQLPDEARSAALLQRIDVASFRATLGGVLIEASEGEIALKPEQKRRSAASIASSPSASGEGRNPGGSPPWSRFLPGFDLAPAAALSRLAGRAPPPPSPLGDRGNPGS